MVAGWFREAILVRHRAGAERSGAMQGLADQADRETPVPLRLRHLVWGAVGFSLLAAVARTLK